jgi:hypothetical protein
MFFSAKVFRTLLALPLLLVLWHCASAQAGPTKDPLNPDIISQGDDLCQKTGDMLMDELRMKACIKQRQKEYSELLGNGEEAVKLSSELEKSFDKTESLAAEDQKKLERLEKLFKKIRGSLGGEEDDPASDEDKPQTLKAAINALNEKASNLLDELKKSTRYSISVLAIQSSNVMIRLVKYIRFTRN